MYCFNCGNALTEHANYCHHCGTRVHHPVVQNNGNSVVVPLPSNASAASSSRRSIIEYNVVLKSTKQTSNVTLVKQLLMSFNPKWDASDCERALNRTTVVYSGPRQQALAVASQFSKAGTIVSVESETGQVLASSEYSGNFPPIPAASPCAASSPYFAPSSQPSTSIRWGCLVVVGGVFLIGLASVIATAIKKERENRAKPELFAGSAAPKVSAPSKPVAPKVIPAYVKECSALKPFSQRKPITFPVPAFKCNITDGACFYIPTQKGKGFDKTIKRYGVKRIRKINKLLPKVAEWASYVYPPDDKIIYVCVSDNRSTDSELVFFVDNEKSWNDRSQRLYISENDLPDKITEPSTLVKLRKLTDSHKNMAVQVAKNVLENPDSFKTVGVSCVNREKEETNVVTLEFYANNRYNYQQKYKAEISFNIKNEIVHQNFMQVCEK